MRRRPRTRRTIAAIAAAFAVVAAGAFLVGWVTSDGGGLRVNGGEIQQNLYEFWPGVTLPPPQCSPLTSDGIGDWACRVTYKRGERIVTQRVRVSVMSDGSMSGDGPPGYQRFSACCAELR